MPSLEVGQPRPSVASSCRKPYAVSRHLSVVSCQFSLVTCQLSVVSRQSSVVSRRPSDGACQFPAFGPCGICALRYAARRPVPGARRARCARGMWGAGGGSRVQEGAVGCRESGAVEGYRLWVPPRSALPYLSHPPPNPANPTKTGQTPIRHRSPPGPSLPPGAPRLAHAMTFHAIPCNATQCNVTSLHFTPCPVTPCPLMPCNAMQCNVLPWHAMRSTDTSRNPRFPIRGSRNLATPSHEVTPLRHGTARRRCPCRVAPPRPGISPSGLARPDQARPGQPKPNRGPDSDNHPRSTRPALPLRTSKLPTPKSEPPAPSSQLRNPKSEPSPSPPTPNSQPSTLNPQPGNPISDTRCPDSKFNIPHSDLHIPTSTFRSPVPEPSSPQSDLHTTRSRLRPPISHLRPPISGRGLRTTDSHSDLRTPISNLQSPRYTFHSAIRHPPPLLPRRASLPSPRHATPRQAMPGHATPRHATPHHTTPQHNTTHHTGPPNSPKTASRYPRSTLNTPSATPANPLRYTLHATRCTLHATRTPTPTPTRHWAPTR
jgi:hypothetical protein